MFHRLTPRHITCHIDLKVASSATTKGKDDIAILIIFTPYDLIVLHRFATLYISESRDQQAKLTEDVRVQRSYV